MFTFGLLSGLASEAIFPTDLPFESRAALSAISGAIFGGVAMPFLRHGQKYNFGDRLTYTFAFGAGNVMGHELTRAIRQYL